MGRCPICGEMLQDAIVVCRNCGEELPLHIIVVSEGSWGGGFAIAVERKVKGKAQEIACGNIQEEVNER